MIRALLSEDATLDEQLQAESGATTITAMSGGGAIGGMGGAGGGGGAGMMGSLGGMAGGMMGGGGGGGGGGGPNADLYRLRGKQFDDAPGGMMGMAQQGITTGGGLTNLLGASDPGLARSVPMVRRYLDQTVNNPPSPTAPSTIQSTGQMVPVAQNPVIQPATESTPMMIEATPAPQPTQAPPSVQGSATGFTEPPATSEDVSGAGQGFGQSAAKQPSYFQKLWSGVQKGAKKVEEFDGWVDKTFGKGTAQQFGQFAKNLTQDDDEAVQARARSYQANPGAMKADVEMLRGMGRFSDIRNIGR